MTLTQTVRAVSKWCRSLSTIMVLGLTIQSCTSVPAQQIDRARSAAVSEPDKKTAAKPDADEIVWMKTEPVDFIMICDGYDPRTQPADTPAHNCKLQGKHTLDDLVASYVRDRHDLERCGQYGDWILDQNGNVMYRRKNPDCPKDPKPKGYGSYNNADLCVIDKGDLPESARPRTLNNLGYMDNGRYHVATCQEIREAAK